MVVGEAWLRKIPERFLRANEGGLRGRCDTLPFPMGVPFFLPIKPTPSGLAFVFSGGKIRPDPFEAQQAGIIKKPLKYH